MEPHCPTGRAGYARSRGVRAMIGGSTGSTTMLVMSGVSWSRSISTCCRAASRRSRSSSAAPEGAPFGEDDARGDEGTGNEVEGLQLFAEHEHGADCTEQGDEI